MPNSALSIVQSQFPQVTSVSDGTKNIPLEVTAEDCKFAKRKNYKKCAYARACKRALQLDGVVAMRSTIYLVKGTHATRYILPETVSREITSFDRGAYFAPGLYQLLKPWSRNTLTSKQNQGPHPTKHPGKGRKKAKIRHYTTGIRAIL